MSARLPHQPGADVIEMLPEIPAALQDRISGYLWQPSRDDPERFAARMHIGGGYF
jgi:hypothetical protein